MLFSYRPSSCYRPSCACADVALDVNDVWCLSSSAKIKSRIQTNSEWTYQSPKPTQMLGDSKYHYIWQHLMIPNKVLFTIPHTLTLLFPSWRIYTESQKHSRRKPSAWNTKLIAPHKTRKQLRTTLGRHESIAVCESQNLKLHAIHRYDVPCQCHMKQKYQTTRLYNNCLGDQHNHSLPKDNQVVSMYMINRRSRQKSPTPGIHLETSRETTSPLYLQCKIIRQHKYFNLPKCSQTCKRGTRCARPRQTAGKAPPRTPPSYIGRWRPGRPTPQSQTCSPLVPLIGPAALATTPSPIPSCQISPQGERTQQYAIRYRVCRWRSDTRRPQKRKTHVAAYICTSLQPRHVGFIWIYTDQIVPNEMRYKNMLSLDPTIHVWTGYTSFESVFSAAAELSARLVDAICIFCCFKIFQQ